MRLADAYLVEPARALSSVGGVAAFLPYRARCLLAAFAAGSAVRDSSPFAVG
jgi:hypothetical protein